jgi:manganese-dependent inorganic pyrophosphatase
MKTLIVIGHKNPDTDSIAAAFALAELLNRKPKCLFWFSNFKAEAGRAGSLNKETEFVFDYFQAEIPCLIKNIGRKNVFLVDHNEPGQSPAGIEKANVLGVIDHHSLGGLTTASSVFYHAEPVGSTSAIVAKMFLKNKVALDKKTAGLLLAAILSDTLQFTSPTATSEDKKTAEILAGIAKERMGELSKKMFKAKSDIEGISIQKLISQDYKEFQVGKTIFGFGVWETADPSQIEAVKERIFSALARFKKKQGTDLMFFALVDILEKKSKIFLLGEEEKLTAEKAFRKKVDGDFLFLPGVVSRKKQMVPHLKKFLSKVKK